jgi:hypothetical protein
MSNHEMHEVSELARLRRHEMVLDGVQSGIVRELLELRGMIG